MFIVPLSVRDNIIENPRYYISTEILIVASLMEQIWGSKSNFSVVAPLTKNMAVGDWRRPVLTMGQPSLASHAVLCSEGQRDRRLSMPCRGITSLTPRAIQGFGGPCIQPRPSEAANDS